MKKKPNMKRYDWSDDLKGMMIRQARLKLNMDQDQFANILGSSRTTVLQWEAERRIPRGPTFRLFLLVCESQGISFDKKGVIR